MKKNFLLIIALMFIGAIQAQTLPYRVSNAGAGSTNVTAEINGYLTTSQQSVSLQVYSDIYTGIWTGTADYDYYVNGNLIGSSTNPTNTIDISAYIPVTSVKAVSNAWTWSVIEVTVVVTPAVGLTSGPTVSDVVYCKNATASPLQASLTGSGTALKWFTSNMGNGYSTTAPTPSTSSVGTTTYYVSQSDVAGVESQRSIITVTVVDQVEITCADDKTVMNPVSQSQVNTEFIAFLNSFSNNSTVTGTFSSETNGFTSAYAPANWTNIAQSPSSYVNHSASTLNIGANAGGAGSTRQIIIPAAGTISFDWSATYTGSGGYTFEYIINGVTTVITTGTGSGSKTNIAVSAGDVFQIRTWGYTQNSTYSTSITNFKVSSSLSSVNVAENGFVNTMAPANWVNVAQSPSSYVNFSSSALTIGANSGGAGSTRRITIPYDGKISFDWSGTFTGSGGYTYQYRVNGQSTVLATSTTSGSVSNLLVNAGDEFEIYTWGFTQSSTYVTSITNFTYEYSENYLGAVAGFFDNEGSIDVTYTVENTCGQPISCTKRFSTVKSITTDNNKLSFNKIQHYPNPTRGDVTITLDQKASLSIFSLEGKLMKTQMLNAGDNRINLDEFKAGVYGFRVVSKDNVSTFNVIKQ
jgi:hypothetical protein